MIDAALISKLATAGLSAEQIALVATIIQENAEVFLRKAEERRQKDRERKEKAKEKQAKEKVPTPLKENNPLGIINNPSPPDRFDEWWEAYPLKKSKGKARKAWTSALKKTSADVLIAAAKAWATKQVGVEPKYIKHPATWLNDEVWVDADLKPLSEPVNGFNKTYVKFNTPAGEAWAEFLKTQGKKIPRDFNGGWWFETEYPPSPMAQ